jgi:hypothetical protein
LSGHLETRLREVGPAIQGCKLGYGACVALVALAAFFAGCGGGSSDRSEIESTLTGSLNDFLAGNWEGACEAMTGPESRKVTEGIADFKPTMRSMSCPEAMSRVSKDLGPGKEVLENLQIGEVKVSGNTATAEIGSGSGAEPVRFEKTNGSWYVAGGGPRLQIIH